MISRQRAQCLSLRNNGKGIPVPTEQGKRELRERGNLAPGQLDTQTESAVSVPSEHLKRRPQERSIFVARQPANLVSEQLDCDPETSILTSETSSQSGLQHFLVERELVPRAPGIGQLELMPKLRLIFEQTKTKDHHQSYFKFSGAIHSRAETRCTITINSINLAISFIPWEDDAIVYNETSKGFVLASVPDEFNNLEIRPRGDATIYPGIWELRGDKTSVKFRLRPRRFRLFLEEQSHKRIAEEDVLPSEKVRGSRGQRMLPQRRARFLKRDEGVDIFKAFFKSGDDASQPRVVVVKMHKPHRANIESAIGCWSREYNVHHGLQHRFIPNLVSFDSRMLTLMMEYKDFSDLGSKQCALAYIAREGIVHTDIKANNILYGGRATPGGAILIDFGLSRYIEQEPRDIGGGSPWYV
ncbi:Serine/threonine-protein kinase tousled-like 2 [Cytospora mali]|uniref:Serine/threonine-protein kinase tousled-like 2 n=1 Tax=Cytospora mali TaxID=578113 RepID=A0A194VCD1_CYTMA|nr:Serine/threonine-protein kinase tousled-like 2 [Valsa mali var. pyri (nom. inval.)]